MFSDIGALEVVTIVVLAVIVFGPEKLPKVIQDVAGFIRKIREFSDNAKEDIRSELGPQFKDFEFEDLNPKTFVRKQLMEGNDDLGLGEIRSSFDLRKEISDITDVVNGRESDSTEEAAPAAVKTLSGSSANGSSANGSTTLPDLLKKSPATTPDLLKKPAPAERPLFDSDAT
ncbi:MULTISPECIES: sec-independent translocase [unclassified Streptomyces]|uniref:sec-independent translocase n=1 Tax=unclassified Streptomyces TaxID=2593676 RepID=UPI00382926A9